LRHGGRPADRLDAGRPAPRREHDLPGGVGIRALRRLDHVLIRAPAPMACMRSELGGVLARSMLAFRRPGRIRASVPIPKFASACAPSPGEFGNKGDTGTSMILVPFLTPKFAIGFAAR